MAAKKRKVCRVDVVSARAPDKMSDASDESAQIAGCPTSVSMDVTGSGTVNLSPPTEEASRKRPLDGHETCADVGECTNP